MITVVAVCRDADHHFSKQAEAEIRLIQNEGVEGDAHRGVTVKHRSRVAKDPTQPNLRQVHLIHNELIQTLQTQGFNVYPGAMGENITTEGIDLLGLPTGAILRIGQTAEVEITGLRNPCKQLDAYQDGLMGAVLDRDEEGNLIRKAGIMGIVLIGGVIRTGDTIDVVFPPGPHVKLERV